MNELLISKFNPELRDSSGRYLADDWTSVSDIGGLFGGKRLDLESYLTVEEGYVKSVSALLSQADINRVRVEDLEIKEQNLEHLVARLKFDTRRALRAFENPRPNLTVTKMNISSIVRLALREIVWCRLSGDRGFYVHFGYDYYMYAGFRGGCIDRSQAPDAIYWEDHPSPYA